VWWKELEKRAHRKVVCICVAGLKTGDTCRYQAFGDDVIKLGGDDSEAG
jgi:hypothetical protein